MDLKSKHPLHKFILGNPVEQIEQLVSNSHKILLVFHMIYYENLEVNMDYSVVVHMILRDISNNVILLQVI